ncbi:ATP-binding protein [Pseudomonas sp. PDM18]|uniref:ATP-binding protein n=1 Tax=Pseudomonas nitroreducens TaxID=46680 RepID=A0A5R9AHX1_PSENT|nr:MULTISPECIES: ATP-binding protein [Pseudomonas]MBD9679440.1 ATP-binding protein [Pseudomonas sp. PDM18]TLP77655.1 ATP-binding protein [Pseudomonas nitroreducens]
MSDAVYSLSEIPEHSDNPLIEALPPIKKPIETVRSIINTPELPNEDTALASSVRIHLLNRINQVIQPFQSHIQIEQSISILIRNGYLGRNPFNATTVRHLHTINQRIHSGFNSTASSGCVFGLSGMGKTTAVTSILKTYPQIITHNKYKDRAFIQKQVVWLKIDSPADGSIKSLCCSFIRALGAALCDEKIVDQARTLRSTSQLIQTMSQLASTYYLGLLVVDEIQTLNRTRAGRESLLDHLLILINEIGIPILFVGTFSAIRLFDGNLRTTRRMCGMGMIAMDRFESTDPEWNGLIEKLWKYQWVHHPIELTDSIKKTIYDLTQGITDLLVKLLISAQYSVIGSRNEEINESVLMKVFENRLSPLKPAMDALRSGGYKSKDLYEDLLPSKALISSMMNTPFAVCRDISELISNIEGNYPPTPTKTINRAPTTKIKAPKKPPKDIIDMTKWVAKNALEFSGSIE